MALLLTRYMALFFHSISLLLTEYNSLISLVWSISLFFTQCLYYLPDILLSYWVDFSFIDSIYSSDVLSYLLDIFRIYSLWFTYQHTATHCNILRNATHFSTLWHAATHCNALQRTATHCNALQHTATHCNALQRTATHCKTLQHTATHCNTLQHTAT